MPLRAILQESFPIAGTSTGAIWRHSPDYIMPEHFHAQLELLVVLRGWIEQRIARRVHVAHAGQILWNLPSLPHALVARSSDLDLRVLHFEPQLLLALQPPAGNEEPRSAADPFAGWLRGLGSLAAGRPVVELRRVDFDALLEDCDSTFDDELPVRDQTPRLQRLLGTAVRATLRDHTNTRPSSIAELACGLLLEDATLSRPALCRRLDLSEGYLSRCFARELGLSFVEQRARVRVARCAALVATEPRRLLEAGLRVGFGSYEQMFRSFQRFAGSGPRAYLFGGGRARRASLTRRDFE